jgi:hypothetical protein
MNHYTLAALKVERRLVAAAVFKDTNLDYTQLRQLSAKQSTAEASSLGFVHWVATALEIDSATLEKAPPKPATRRTHLSRMICRALQSSGIPVWRVSKLDLLAAFGEPPLKTRKELRERIVSIWPILDRPDRERGLLDAVALGLFVQTERLFLN